MSRSITPSQILTATQKAIDEMGEILDRSWTESEECRLAVKVMEWLRDMGEEVSEE